MKDKNLDRIFLDSVEKLNEVINQYKDNAGESLSISFSSDSSDDWSNRYRKSPQISVQAIKDIAVHFPNLYRLAPQLGLIPIDVLKELKSFKHLKSLSLYWSGLGREHFFEYIPKTIENLDLSRTVACRMHSTEELKELLERLTHLKSLNLAETDLPSFPKLSRPNLKLKKLELFHHTIYEHNKRLTGEDLENIAGNFPNLKELNIIACDAIDINDTRTKKAIESLASREDFSLFANESVLDYFYYCKSITYLKSVHGLSEATIQGLIEQHPEWIKLLTSNNAKSLLTNKQYTLDQLMELLTKNEELFKTLTYSKAFHFVAKEIISFEELTRLYALYGEDINMLLNWQTSYLILGNHLTVPKLLELYELHGKAIEYLLGWDVSYIMEENKLSFKMILKAFEFDPALLKKISSFSNRYKKTAENLSAEIEMLTHQSSDSAAYKRLDQQDTSLKTLKLNYISDAYALNAKGLENILFNFPKLDELSLDDGLSHFKFSSKERAALLTIFDEYLITNPDFSLGCSLWSGKSDILKLFSKAVATSFYVKNKGISHEDLVLLRTQERRMFSKLAKLEALKFSNVVDYDFAAMVALFKAHPAGFKHLTSYEVQEIIKNNWMTMDEICKCYDTNPKKFKALMNYSIIEMINEKYLTWAEINQIFDKDEKRFKKLCELYSGKYVNPDVKQAFQKLKDRILSVENEKTAEHVEEDPSKYKPSAMGFFANVQVAFTKYQARLAAEWYYEVLESGLIARLHKKTIVLNEAKKEVFINTLEKGLWDLLSTDLTLSIKGQSPFYLNWSNPLISEALKQADIPLDNTKTSFLIFVFIGQYDSTTYQLGDDVGDCENYLGYTQSSDVIPTV